MTTLRFLLSVGLTLALSALASAQNASGALDNIEDDIIMDDRVPDELIVKGIYNADTQTIYAAASIDILSTDDITRISAVHPAEALNAAAGVNIHRGSGQEHLTAMRSPVLTGGAGAGSFLYLEDGIPLRAAGFANVNGLFEAGTEFTGKYEVFKGPGPVEFGSNAVHGLINVQSRDTQYGDNYARVLASDDGFVSALTSHSNGHLRASVSLAHDDGFRADSGFDQQKIQLKYQKSFGRWSVDALSSFTNLNQETAGFIQGEQAYKDRAISKTNPNPEAFRDGKSYRAQAKFSRNINGKTLAITPYARRAELRFLRHFVPGQALEKNGNSSVGVKTAYFGDGLNIGADVEYTNGFLYEFQANPSRFSFVQGLHYDYEVESLVAAAYAEKEFYLGDDFGLTLGARAEYTRYNYENLASDGRSGRFIRAADRKNDFFVLTPKASLQKQLGHGQAYVRAARGARAPQVTDLYSVQLNQAAGEADVETLDSVEFGYKYARGAWRYELAAFAMKKDNFFFRNANGFNVEDGKTNHTGLEASFKYQENNWLSLSGDFSLAKHSYDFTLDEGSAANTITDGTRVDSAPDTLGTMRVTATPTDKLMGEIEWRHVGAYFTNPGNTARYGGHDIFVARASYALSDNLILSGRVDNLFNARYADRADFAFGNERYFPGRPRTAFIGLSTDF